MVLMKNALAALMGVAIVAEAATMHQIRGPSSGVARRQGKFFRGGGKNNNNNNQNNNQGGQQNNNQNNNGQNNNQNNNGQNNQNNNQNNNGQNNQNNNQNNNGQNNNNNNNNNNNGQNNNQASETCLAAGAVQTGSFSTGQNGGAVADGQVESRTDQANFINECNGKELTNGLQNRGGSCNGIPMGNIPGVDNMVSTVILNPKNLDVIPPNQSFQIQVLVQNMQLGFFTNATSTYYSAPQEVNAQGNIIGHTHVTVQDTGASLDPQQPLDPKQFAFFKGINDAGNGQGNLQATVDGGLPAGNYRVCTMAGASNHQPVLMPVAQRGSQEDCKYFTVSDDANANAGAGGGNNQNNNNNNQGGQQNNNQGGQQNNNQGGQQNNNQGGQQNQDNANQGGQQNQDNANQGGQQNQDNANQGGQQNQDNANQGGQQNNNQGGQQNNNQGGQQNNNGGGFGGRFGGRFGKNRNGQNNNQGGQQQNNQGGQQQNNNQGGQQQNNNQGGQQNAGGNANAGGAIGGIQAPEIQDSGSGDRQFSVNGDTFATREAAAQRACAIQNNACADAVNGGQVQGATVPDCNAQEAACRAAAGA